MVGHFLEMLLILEQADSSNLFRWIFLTISVSTASSNGLAPNTEVHVHITPLPGTMTTHFIDIYASPGLNELNHVISGGCWLIQYYVYEKSLLNPYRELCLCSQTFGVANNSAIYNLLSAHISFILRDLEMWKLLWIRGILQQILESQIRREGQQNAICGICWHHDMETLSVSLTIREGNPTVAGGFLSQGPVSFSGSSNNCTSL